MVSARFAVAVVVAATLAACSGASALKSSLPYAPAAGTANAPAGPATRHKNVTVSLKLFIPNRLKRHHASGPRRPDFISAATNLIYATVYPVGSPAQSVVTATGVGPDSTPCVPVTGGRLCTVSVPAPLGSDVFVFDTLDGGGPKIKRHGAAPSATGGSLLYLGQSYPVTETIVADRTNVVAATIHGIVGEFSTPPNPSAVYTGGLHITALDLIDLAPADAESQTIAAPVNDGYFTPYTATVTEHGGTGFATLALFDTANQGGNPVAKGSAISILLDTQTAAIEFFGAMPAGYYATVTYSAATFTGPDASPQPVTPVSVRIAPMIVTSTSSAWIGQDPALTFTSYPASATLNLSEAALSPLAFTSKLSAGCSGIVTAKLTQAPGTSATVVVNVVSLSGTNVCTLTLGDGTSSVVIPVSVTTTGIPITIPSPSVSEYPLTGTGPLSIAFGADGNMWFTEATTGRIGTIAIPSFALTEEPTALPGVAGIISGPPGILETVGLLWFADGAGIGSATASTPQGYHGPWAPPTGTFGPAGLTIGPDANVWFTDPASNQVGSVTPDGSIQEFPIPTASSGPASVASDGTAIWFTEHAGNRIGRMDLSDHSVVESAVATGSKPQGMTRGPDGNIWFTQCGGAAIARATFANGVITITKHATTAAGGPYGIATGPDGRLWVTETTLGRIGRYDTTAGTFVDWALPTAASGPRGIAAGPDGAVWFTEFSKNRIGRAVNLH
jgi:virginiamycin B lyase